MNQKPKRQSIIVAQLISGSLSFAKKREPGHEVAYYRNRKTCFVSARYNRKLTHLLSPEPRNRQGLGSRRRWLRIHSQRWCMVPSRNFLTKAIRLQHLRPSGSLKLVYRKESQTRQTARARAPLPLPCQILYKPKNFFA